MDSALGCLAVGAAPSRVSLPVRSFDPSLLELGPSRSLLARLLEASSLVVVQEADLRPTAVRTHCGRLGLEHLAVFDYTKRLNLRGRFSQSILKRSDPLLRAIQGERIW